MKKILKIIGIIVLSINIYFLSIVFIFSAMNSRKGQNAFNSDAVFSGCLVIMDVIFIIYIIISFFKKDQTR